MRVLACSDIHGNVAAMRRLRAREPDRFDLILVPGDLGSGAAEAILAILASFGCPVAFVYGNRDSTLPYGLPAPPNCHHLHGSPLELGRVRVAGFSGCPTSWGRNPIAAGERAAFADEQAAVLARLKDAKASGPAALASFRRSPDHAALLRAERAMAARILAANRAELAAALPAGPDGRFTFVLTHERLARATDQFPAAACFVFGHLHRFSWTRRDGADFLNAAALDKPLAVRSRAAPDGNSADLRPVNAGNYATFTVRDGAMAEMEVTYLGWDTESWVPVAGRKARGGAHVGDDPARDRVVAMPPPLGRR